MKTAEIIKRFGCEPEDEYDKALIFSLKKWIADEINEMCDNGICSLAMSLDGGDGYIGYNTDCDGFLRSIEAAGGKLDGTVLQCGCGGVGRMIAIECVRHGAKLTVSVPEGFEDTVEPVKEYARANGFSDDIKVVHPNEIEGKFDTLINASPVGMFPKVENCPVTEDIIANCGFVFDVIYNPERTKLMQTAEKHGIKTCGGMAMLVWQAVVAHEIWSGANYSDSDIAKLISDMHKLMAEKE